MAVNPRAYHHGAVFVQCKGCKVFHKVRLATARVAFSADHLVCSSVRSLIFVSYLLHFYAINVQVADHINFMGDM